MALEYRTLRNYASRCNDYQDDNSNSITNNTVYKQRDCWGWGQKQGTDSPQMSETVTLPFSYDSAPTPFISIGGTKATTAAANITEINSFYGANTAVAAGWSLVAVNSFVVYLSRSDTTNISSAAYCAYSWFTRGTYAAI